VNTTEAMVLEALTADWQDESAVVRYVQTHARRVVDELEVRAALRALALKQSAESTRFPGYRRDHWRRTAARRVA
jgi:hypothetical protein